MSIIIENEMISDRIVIRNCHVLVKKDATGLIVEGCVFEGRPSWRTPIKRLRFWRKWRTAL